MENNFVIGVVVIGRNEGERLGKCLRSCLKTAANIVYVDSGSEDHSVELAKGLGVEVVNLDNSIPFSAARARNEGVKRLVSLNSSLTYVQFVDGDCEIFTSWLSSAAQRLNENNDLAIVCGRLRERFPNRSIYNRICDIEWNSPSGEISACGGLFMIRLDVFENVSGFNPDIIAGEEPELCIRVRRSGKKIFRMPEEMAWHDADMKYFGQWWKRMIRGGHAYAQGAAMYGNDSERFCVKECFSILIWALVIPIVIGILSNHVSIWYLVFLLIYPYKIYRVAGWANHLADRKGDRWLYATVCVLGKWPELIGLFKFWINNALGRKTKLIEHR